MGGSVARHAPHGRCGFDVAALLTKAGQWRGKLPELVQCDQGIEFRAIALDR